MEAIKENGVWNRNLAKYQDVAIFCLVFWIGVSNVNAYIQYAIGDNFFSSRRKVIVNLPLNL